MPSAPISLSGTSDGPYRRLAADRQRWELEDCYQNPGTLQFQGPSARILALTLKAEQVRHGALTSVRKTPSWPRGWELHSHRNAWANLHLLGKPNTFFALRRMPPRVSGCTLCLDLRRTDPSHAKALWTG